MKFFDDKTISAIVILIMLTVTLCSCAPKRMSNDPDGVLETVANSDSIASGLVCVFAPNVCVEKKELGETEDAK